MPYFYMHICPIPPETKHPHQGIVDKALNAHSSFNPAREFKFIQINFKTHFKPFGTGAG